MASSLTDGLRLGRGSSDDPAFMFIKTLNWANCGHLCAVRLKDLSYHIICGFFYVVLVFCLQANMKTGKLLSPFVCIGHLCNLDPKSNIKELCKFWLFMQEGRCISS